MTYQDQKLMSMRCNADKNVGSGDKYSGVLKLMQFIGTVYGGASVTQVALNYLRAKGEHCLQLPDVGSSGGCLSVHLHICCRHNARMTLMPHGKLPGLLCRVMQPCLALQTCFFYCLFQGQMHDQQQGIWSKSVLHQPCC